MNQNSVIGKEFKVLDKGFIRVVDVMGSDSAIVQAARVSYGQGTKTVNEDRGLIRYLVRNRHTSPLEMCELKLHIKMPIFIARQWIRHRTASLNEYSARYSEMKDEFFIPEKAHGQDTVNKQGSAAELEDKISDEFNRITTDQSEISYKIYKECLDAGISREMARIVLPLNIYTEFYWKIDLHNLLHFCSLRSDSHAQKEIRAYSDVILNDIIKEWCPLTYQAFLDYRMNGKSFSAQEIEILKSLVLSGEKYNIGALLLECTALGLSTNESFEFLKKIGINEKAK